MLVGRCLIRFFNGNDISQYRTRTGMSRLRERNLVCDHGSEVLVGCPEWLQHKYSGNKCEGKKKYIYIYTDLASEEVLHHVVVR